MKICLCDQEEAIWDAKCSLGLYYIDVQWTTVNRYANGCIQTLNNNAATLLGLDTVSSTALYLNYHHKIVLPFVHDLHYSIEFATDKQRFSPRYVISIILLQVGFKTQYKLTIN